MGGGNASAHFVQAKTISVRGQKCVGLILEGGVDLVRASGLHLVAQLGDVTGRIVSETKGQELIVRIEDLAHGGDLVLHLGIIKDESLEQADSCHLAVSSGRLGMPPSMTRQLSSLRTPQLQLLS